MANLSDRFLAGDDYTKKIRQANGIPELASVSEMKEAVMKLMHQGEYLQAACLVMNRQIDVDGYDKNLQYILYDKEEMTDESKFSVLLINRSFELNFQK